MRAAASARVSCASFCCSHAGHRERGRRREVRQRGLQSRETHDPDHDSHTRPSPCVCLAVAVARSVSSCQTDSKRMFFSLCLPRRRLTLSRISCIFAAFDVSEVGCLRASLASRFCPSPASAAAVVAPAALTAAAFCLCFTLRFPLTWRQGIALPLPDPMR